MRTLYLALTLLLPAFSQASAAEVFCPKQVESSAITVNKIPEGWQSSLREYPLELSGVIFSDGPPTEKAYLKENSTRENKKTLVSKQVFDSPAIKENYWLICAYAGNVLFLSKPIPKEIRECTVTHDKPENSIEKYRFRSLVCK